MRLLADVPGEGDRRCVAQGVRLEVIGRRDRLDAKLCAAIARAEAATAAGNRLWLRMAVDYSGARRHPGRRPRACANSPANALERAMGPPVDLLIRTGGERRLSDFLLWECAYAELVFSRTHVAGFRCVRDSQAAIREFHGRQRRFGGVPAGAHDVRKPGWIRSY